MLLNDWIEFPTTCQKSYYSLQMIISKFYHKVRIISKSGQEWTLPAQLGQLKTGQERKELLRIHLWCPDDLPRLWDRIE